MPAPKSWLPIDWRHPTNALLPTGHHLRPIGPHDASMAVEALRGSREHLRQTYGKVRAWPLTAMAGPQDREELRRNEDDTVTHRSFHYALFDLDETELIGCVYIDPTDEPGRTQTYRGGCVTSMSEWWSSALSMSYMPRGSWGTISRGHSGRISRAPPDRADLPRHPRRATQA